jgi:catechol 2,3-dioxygenase-like lactoylglutathione lyase family enzyme
MPDAIDHVVIACSDPDAAADEIEARLGLRATGAGRHTALGTFNRLIWLGDSFIELIGVEARKLAEASWIGRPVLAAADAGGGFATWAAVSNRIAAEVADLRSGGSTIEEPRAGERVRPDGRVVRWTLAVALPLGPLEPPFLIEHDMTAAEWSPAERAEREAQGHPIGGPVRLDVLELPTPDVRRATDRYLRMVGIGPFRPSLAGHGGRDAALGPHTVRFVPDPGPGWPVATIHLRVALDDTAPGTEVRSLELFGCRWVIRAS